MSRQNRRQFLRNSVLGTGALATSALATSACSVIKAPFAPKATDRIQLGQTGITSSYLAMGTGIHGSKRTSDHTRMGQKKFTEVIRHGFDSGINFLDMADLYGTHPFMKKALGEVPRENMVMLSKIWPRKANWNTPSANGIAEVDRFRKELNVDYLDICLLHCMQNDQWTEEFKAMRDGLSELKEKQIVRAVGCSCHNHGALKVAAEHPWVDVIFARINHKGVKMDGTPQEISETLLKARANGKVVVGMKIFGEGQLIKPFEKDASLKYVIGQNLVDAMTIGMLETSEIDDSIARINQTLRA